MSHFQGAANLKDDSRGFLGRQLALFLKDDAEVLPLEILHGDELEAVRLAQVKNPDDVAVCHLASQDEFLLETPEYFGMSGQFRTNNFESNHAIQFIVPRF